MRTSLLRLFALPLSVLVAAVLLTGCQGGSDTKTQESGPPPLPKNELAIENPWVTPAPAGSSSTLYMTIANGQSTADTLVDADAPIIDSTQVFDTVGDTATTAVSSLAIPAQSRLSLEPGGRHVTLLGLEQPLKKGQTLVLNLEFSQSGLRRTRIPIQSSAPGTK